MMQIFLPLEKANQIGIIDIMIADAYHHITDGLGSRSFFAGH